MREEEGEECVFMELLVLKESSFKSNSVSSGHCLPFLPEPWPCPVCTQSCVHLHSSLGTSFVYHMSLWSAWSRQVGWGDLSLRGTPFWCGHHGALCCSQNKWTCGTLSGYAQWPRPGVSGEGCWDSEVLLGLTVEYGASTGCRDGSCGRSLQPVALLGRRLCRDGQGERHGNKCSEPLLCCGVCTDTSTVAPK